MDSLSQLALGAAVSVAVMRRRTAVWKAAAWGAVAGTLPDLDVLVDHGDPILNMVLHRAESHALFWLALNGLVTMPLATALLAPSNQSIARAGLAALALLWLGSMVFGVYHSGVEWKWWPGPSTCGAQSGFSGGLPDLSRPVILCDKAAIRILGLSLAGWNAVISLGLALLALAGLRRQGSSSVSQ